MQDYPQRTGKEAWSVALTPSRTPIGVCLTDVLMPVVPPAADVYATTATSESAQVRPGDVYFAPPVDSTTALRLVQAAADAGAKAVVVDQMLPFFDIPQLVVRDVAESFGRFCHALVDNPSESLAITAIAGGHGKSGTLHLLRSILGSAGAAIETNSTDKLSNAALTASWLAHQTAAGVTHAALEVQPSTYSRSLPGCQFAVACVTNDAGDGSKDVKVAEITQHLDQQGVLVLNADQPTTTEQLGWHGQVLTFGRTSAADVTATVLQRHTAGQTILLRVGADTAAVECNTIGDAHVENCLAAAATALALGVSLTDIAKGIEAAKPLPTCMQPVVAGQGFSIFLDAASDAISLRQAIAATSAIATRKVWTIIDPTTARSMTELAGMMQLAVGRSDSVIAVSHDSMAQTNLAGARLVEDRFTAIAMAIALAEDGDAVLFTGCPAGAAGDEQTVRELLELRLANSDPLPSLAS